ncbi:hypothetical protein [Agrobacterium tumefaciens]|uniref:hypothetical protein n=1 Tax=Agrobacterium tumefaciens TaxID=358 RepID=UPI0016591DD2|nr:hypothetical protein [Agrobacterium tumefaciens]QNP81004.1 hypothetical protein IAI05_07140 [Agrobacterium tumefaciens]
MTAFEHTFNSYEEMAEEASKYEVELQDWLSKFSSWPKKWPDINIASKRRRLAWVQKVGELCRRAAQKRGAA